MFRITLTAVVLLTAQTAFADLQVSSVFTDHAVLQRGMDVPVWGSADAQAKIEVAFADQNKTTHADEDGNWSVSLSPLTASFEPQSLIVTSNGQDIILSDILVGEVWICSGQSNMQMSTGSVPDVKALIPKAKDVRTFEVKRTVAFSEQDRAEGTWQTAIPSSAVAFSFSHFLQQKADVPVGIILSCWGSSSLEAWMPRDMAETTPHFKSMMDDFDADTKTQNRIREILNGKKPWSRQDDIFLRRQSNMLYNAMMHPLAPYACRGLVWYQGERNTMSMTPGRKDPWQANNSGMLQYGATLKQWIQRYRKQWNNDTMEFLVVMLPGFGKILPTGQEGDAEHPNVHSWAWMRESQLRALDLPHTAVVNTIDLGDVKNIHPKDKLPIGQRLALLAARDTLGQNLVAEGPVMSRVEVKGSQIIVHYEHAAGLKTLDGVTPTGFWICDESQHWVEATAKIQRQTVVLSSDALENPLYVRYAFAGKPTVNLINAAELPARPFRSDQFEP